MKSPGSSCRSHAGIVATIVIGLCAAARAEDRYEIENRTDVVYGTVDGEDLLLDLALPKGLEGPAPALIFIHGGGWQGGKRQDFAPMTREFAASGYVAATITYRLAPSHPFPAQVEDCKCAVRWMRAHSGELKIDPERLGVLGGSAGGHLATMLGVMDTADGLEGEGGWPDQSSKVQAVVNFVGPVNLIGDFPEISDNILKVFLNGTPEEREDLYRQASPITYVNKGDAPMLVFAGTKDPLVPFDQAIQMVSALDKAEVPGRVEFLVGAGHGWGGKEMERTMKAAREFFDEHLKK